MEQGTRQEIEGAGVRERSGGGGWGGQGLQWVVPLLTSSAWARCWGNSSCLHCVAFFWETVLMAARLQLEIQVAHEIREQTRADCNTGELAKDTHTHIHTAQSLTRNCLWSLRTH